jgi:hypothetical protein
MNPSALLLRTLSHVHVSMFSSSNGLRYITDDHDLANSCIGGVALTAHRQPIVPAIRPWLGPFGASACDSEEDPGDLVARGVRLVSSLQLMVVHSYRKQVSSRRG